MTYYEEELMRVEWQLAVAKACIRAQKHHYKAILAAETQAERDWLCRYYIDSLEKDIEAVEAAHDDPIPTTNN